MRWRPALSHAHLKRHHRTEKKRERQARLHSVMLQYHYPNPDFIVRSSSYHTFQLRIYYSSEDKSGRASTVQLVVVRAGSWVWLPRQGEEMAGRQLTDWPSSLITQRLAHNACVSEQAHLEMPWLISASHPSERGYVFVCIHHSMARQNWRELNSRGSFSTESWSSLTPKVY